MRLSMQVKDTPRSEPLGVIVDFLRVWYEREELEDRLAHADPTERIREYLLAALAKLQSGEPNLRHELLRADLENVDFEKNSFEVVERFRILAEETNLSLDWLTYGVACSFRNEHALAFEAYVKGLNDRVSVIRPPDAISTRIALARGVFIALLVFLDWWERAVRELAGALVSKDKLPIERICDVLVADIFGHFSSPEVWKSRVREVVKVFDDQNALNYLGYALVRHLSHLATSPISGEGLRQWFEHWESSAEQHEAMLLPLRLLRVGIDYLASQPKDEGKLLQLPEEERSLLRQALSLPKG
jgi:hypothetical protein